MNQVHIPIPPFACRPHCGACCIAPSISSAMPGLPQGKPAGVHCPHLDDQMLCKLWEQPERPAICGNFTPEALVCGQCRAEALSILGGLEGFSPEECSTW